MHKKIRIIGTSGSGKSYIAHILSKVMKIPLYDLDDFYFEEKYSKKREYDEKKEMVIEITKTENRIIEWVYAGDRCHASFQYADYIIYLTTPPLLLIKRLIKREIKKRSPLKHIVWLIRYALSYEKNNEDLQQVLQNYSTKIIRLDKKDITKEKIEKLVSTL